MREVIYRAEYDGEAVEKVHKKLKADAAKQKRDHEKVHSRALDAFVRMYAKYSMDEQDPLHAKTTKESASDVVRYHRLLEAGKALGFTMRHLERVPRDSLFCQYLLTIVDPVLKYMNDTNAHLTYRLGAVHLSHGSMHTNSGSCLKRMQRAKEKDEFARLLESLKGKPQDIAALAQGHDVDASPMLSQMPLSSNFNLFDAVSTEPFKKGKKSLFEKKSEKELTLIVRAGAVQIAGLPTIVRFQPDQTGNHTEYGKHAEEEDSNRFLIEMNTPDEGYGDDRKSALYFNKKGQFYMEAKWRDTKAHSVTSNESKTFNPMRRVIACDADPYIGMHGTLETLVTTLFQHAQGTVKTFEDYKDTYAHKNATDYENLKSEMFYTVGVIPQVYGKFDDEGKFVQQSKEQTPAELFHKYVHVHYSGDTYMVRTTVVKGPYTKLSGNVYTPFVSAQNYIQSHKLTFMTCKGLHGNPNTLETLERAMTKYRFCEDLKFRSGIGEAVSQTLSDERQAQLAEVATGAAQQLSDRAETQQMKAQNAMSMDKNDRKECDLSTPIACSYVCLGNTVGVPYGQTSIPMEEQEKVLQWVNANATLKLIGVEEWKKLRYLMEMEAILNRVRAYLDTKFSYEAVLRAALPFVWRETFPYDDKKRTCHTRALDLEEPIISASLGKASDKVTAPLRDALINELAWNSFKNALRKRAQLFPSHGKQALPM